MAVGENTKVPFGKFSGKTLDAIGSTHDGLLYLDWLVGQDWLFEDLKKNVKEFLQDPDVAKELKVAVENKSK